MHLNEDLRSGQHKDYIHPSVKAAYKSKDGVHGADIYPDTQGPDSYREQLGSANYQSSMDRVKRYTGGGDPGSVMVKVSQILTKMSGIEAKNKDRLEAAAVELVTELPEFSGVKAAIEAGNLYIDARLEPREVEASVGARPGQRPSDLSCGTEAELVDAINDMDSHRTKRAVINTMIGGAAATSNYAFELYSSELKKISPDLPAMYGVLMSAIELGYWVQPRSSHVKAASGDGNLGSTKIESHDNTPTIVARAAFFPVLVHEIVKGLVEYLSYSGLPQNEDMAKSVLADENIEDEADAVSGIGPELWSRLKSSLGPNQRDLPRLYDKLVQLEPDEFNLAIKAIVSGGDKASSTARRLLNRNRTESMDPNIIADLALNTNTPTRDLIRMAETGVQAPTKTPVKPKPTVKPEEVPGPDTDDPWRKREIRPGTSPRPKNLA